MRTKGGASKTCGRLIGVRDKCVKPAGRHGPRCGAKDWRAPPATEQAGAHSGVENSLAMSSADVFMKASYDT